MSLVCFSLITANGWGPSDAYLPISIMLTIYLVAFIGLVGMYFRDARKKRN